MALSYLNVARGVLLGLVVTPFLFANLGDAAFGAWVVILGTTAYVGLLESGLGTALITRVSSLDAVGDRVGVGRVVGTAFWLLAVAGALGLVAVGILGVVFDRLIDAPPTLADDVRTAFVIAGLSQVVMLFNTVSAGAIIGVGRFDTISVIGLFVTIGVSVAQVVLAVAGAGVVGLSLATLVGAVITLVAQFAVFRRLLVEVPIVWRRPQLTTARQLLSLGWRNALVMISAAISLGSDVLIIGILLGVRAAAAYGVASRAALFARSLATTATDVLIPTYSSAAATGNVRRLRSLYQLSVFLNLAIAAPIGIVFIAFGESLLHLWLGEAPPEGATTTLQAFAVLAVLQIPGYCAFLLLMGTERAGFLLRFALVATPLNLVASVLATQLLGTPGPVIGSIAAVLLVEPVLLYFVFRDHLATSVRAFVPIVRGLLAPALVAVALAVAFVSLDADDEPLAGAVAALTVAAVFAVAFTVWITRLDTLRVLGMQTGPVGLVRTLARRSP
jgi:O-antigen/teichoic acid export membrane protein